MVKKKESVEEITEKEKEVFLNIPNLITLLRLALTFIFVYMLIMNFPKIHVLIIFIIAALTDWFDGFLAKKLNQKTKIGAKMDQIVDRIFTILIIVSLIFYFYQHNKLDTRLLLLLLIVSREIISTPGVIINLMRSKSLYKVNYFGRLTTFCQAIAISAIILQLTWAIYLVIPTAIIGMLAAIDYLRYSLK